MSYLYKTMKQSLLYIFTGDGKGKTSAALGVAFRATCANLKVAWVAWYKQASWQTCESQMAKLLLIEVFLMGSGFYIKTSQKSEIRNQNKGTSSHIYTDFCLLSSVFCLLSSALL